VLVQGKPFQREGSIQLNSLYELAAFDIANSIYFFTKQVNLIRRSNVPSLPFQLVVLDIHPAKLK